MNQISNTKQNFHLVLIKPSHYDDDGYVIQWWRSSLPSNTLAVMNALAQDCAARQVLGEDVKIHITAIDETNTRVRPDQIIRKIRKLGGKALIGLVGVQTNQFPRALNIARHFRAVDIPVCIGGFHVSGCLSMLEDIPEDLQTAQELGITLFAGESEGRLDGILRDAYEGTLKPVYNYLNDLPSLAGVPTPILPETHIRKTAGAITCFDAGRGCPFQCSFCTIINVQGRKSRRRTPEEIADIVRTNVAQGITRFFITDDNFARNKDWEAIFDRLYPLRAELQTPFKFVIQVDALCHKIPNFIEKAAKAGVTRAFIGLESINSANLASANKPQNHIDEYRAMLQAWKKARVITFAGYILGLPNDTPESIRRDLRIIQDELPIDILNFSMLTPLPGSADHRKMVDEGAWMEPDMNNYDLSHVTMKHPNMSSEEWLDIYNWAWDTYYAPEHVHTILRRARACGIGVGKVLTQVLWTYASTRIEEVPSVEGGVWRRRTRRDRRPELPLENPLVFYPRQVWKFISTHARLLSLLWQYGKGYWRIKRDPDSRSYTDLTLSEDETKVFLKSQ